MNKFTVPKPCHEEWENMFPEEKGRFCTFCKTKVYDFSNSSDEQIEAIYDQEKGEICGRFGEKQVIPYSRLQNSIINFEAFTQRHFSKFGILVSAASMLMSISGCIKKTDTSFNKTDVERDTADYNSDNIPNSTTIGEVAPMREDSAQFPKPRSEHGFPLGKIAPTKRDSIKDSVTQTPRKINDPLGKIAPVNPEKIRKKNVTPEKAPQIKDQKNIPPPMVRNFPPGEVVQIKDVPDQPASPKETSPVIMGKPVRKTKAHS